MSATQDWKTLSDSLSQTLGLKHAPIAITFSDEAPADVALYETDDVPAPSADGRTGKVPAGCVFWIKSQEGTFTTQPEDHHNCSVGSVTHGIKLLDDVMDKEDIAELVGSGWVTAEEAMALPVVQEKPNYITYGPLAETPIDPDVILLRVNAFQAMVVHDAYGDMPVVGKPQCHIIPMAKEQGQIAMSTGCMLSRVRTGMQPEEMTCTIPARELSNVIDRLEARRQANASVSAYATKDADRFTG